MVCKGKPRTITLIGESFHGDLVFQDMKTSIQLASMKILFVILKVKIDE